MTDPEMLTLRMALLAVLWMAGLFAPWLCAIILACLSDTWLGKLHGVWFAFECAAAIAAAGVFAGLLLSFYDAEGTLPPTRLVDVTPHVIFVVVGAMVAVFAVGESMWAAVWRPLILALASAVNRWASRPRPGAERRV